PPRGAAPRAGPPPPRPPPRGPPRGRARRRQPGPPLGRGGGRRARPPHRRRPGLGDAAARPRRRTPPAREGNLAMTATTKTTGTIAAASPPGAGLGVLAQYGLLAGPLLSMLDASIISVAVAPIARQLPAPLGQVGWAVSGYLPALGVALPATSWLARRFGTLHVYTASVIGFTTASACCAAAPDARLLIAAR